MSGRPDENVELSYKNLRTYVGAMGFLLPIAAVFGDRIVAGRGLRDSISAYYYSSMRDVFVGILSVVGVFLIAYRGPREPDGKAPDDDRVSTAAGICALLVAAFPTTNDSVAVEDTAGAAGLQHVGTLQWSPGASAVLHFASAAVLFVLLAYMSLRVFTRTRDPGHMSPEKQGRNRFYKWCGWVMLGALVAIAACKLPFIEPRVRSFHPTLVGEWVALWAFALSWLTKGEKLPIYKDPPEEEDEPSTATPPSSSPRDGV